MGDFDLDLRLGQLDRRASDRGESGTESGGDDCFVVLTSEGDDCVVVVSEVPADCEVTVVDSEVFTCSPDMCKVEPPETTEIPEPDPEQAG
jgi:hypothetical protein